MEFDNSWDALLNPGDATIYFDVHRGTPFDAKATSYSSLNAWWLAELSRLIYKQGSDEPKPSRGELTRKEALKGVGLTEEFRQKERVQFALVKPQDDSFRVLVFRGSHNLIDWLTNFDARPVTCSTAGKVHEGFERALDAVWEGEILNLLRGWEGPVFFTGHSLGAALATLAAARYTASYKKPCQLYTFGSPFVGDAAFVGRLGKEGRYRIVNNLDIVTTMPPCDGLLHADILYYITHEHGVLVGPSLAQIAADRMKKDSASFFDKSFHLHFTDAPERMADHAPVNYVAHLERAVI
jgi:hypothetical protein